MKKYDWTSIIGAIVCVVVLVVMFLRVGTKRPTPAETPVAEMTPAQTQLVPAQNPKPETPKDAVAPTSETVSPMAASDPLLPVGDAPRAMTGMAPLVIQNGDEAVISIDPAGAGIVAVEMLKYDKQREKGVAPTHVVLGHYDYPFMCLGSMNGKLPWQAVSPEGAALSDDGKTVTIERISVDGKLKIIETWSVAEADRYEINYRLVFKNLSDGALKIDGLALEGGALSPMMAGAGERTYCGVGFMFPPATKNHCEQFTEGQLRQFREAREILNANKADADTLEKARKKLKDVNNLAWASVHTRYFMQGIRAKDPKFLFASLEANACAGVPEMEADPNGRFRARLGLPSVFLDAHAEMSFDFIGFAGPMDLNLLASKNVGLDGMLGVDRFFWSKPRWMNALSKFFLNSLLWLGKFFPGRMSIGWGVVLLTILVKLILWPLSLRGTRSMRRMQEIQPMLKELREKYKNDPQEMYRRQQQLFKDNHVSQFGGCLPMLLQIPIFFALFNTFRGSIELRQAHFLWAHDLSLPDTIFSIGPLPVNPFSLIMVGTMIWQQAQTPSSDPSQKRMMIVMSLVFTYFLYTQPSGLTLYMTVNMILSIVQTYVIKKLDGAPTAAPAAAK